MTAAQMKCMPSREEGGMASPLMAKMMQPIMGSMMNSSMKVTEHDNDASYKEVQDFMVPSSSGKPFVDAPGTFDKGMSPRTSEVGMPMMGMKVMRMTRTEMLKQPAPHNKGITWEKFAEHRGYALPGCATCAPSNRASGLRLRCSAPRLRLTCASRAPADKPKHPQPGDKVPDGKILSISGDKPSTLLTEAKKLAAEAGSSKVSAAAPPPPRRRCDCHHINRQPHRQRRLPYLSPASPASQVILCFDAITCPFFRAYAAEDLYKAPPRPSQCRAPRPPATHHNHRAPRPRSVVFERAGAPNPLAPTPRSGPGPGDQRRADASRVPARGRAVRRLRRGRHALRDATQDEAVRGARPSTQPRSLRPSALALATAP